MNRFRPWYLILCALFIVVLARPATGQTGQDCTGNESWIGVGAGLPDEVIASTEMNGKLYVLHHLPGDSAADRLVHRISVWDGVTWSTVTSFRFLQPIPDHQITPVNAFQAFNGELYMSGSFTGIGDNPDLTGIVRWNGTEWIPARGSISLEMVNALTVHNGKLIASGTVPMDNFSWKILQWDGTDWSYVGDPGKQPENLYMATSMVSWNGNLYASGLMSKIGTIAQSMIVQWNGEEWKEVEGIGFGMSQKLFIYRNQLHATGIWRTPDGERSSPIARWDGTTWLADIPFTDRSGWNITLVAVYNDQIYAVTPNDSFPTSVSKAPVFIDRYDGTAWHRVTNFDSWISVLVPYKNGLFAGGSFSNSCGTPLSNFAMLCDARNCGRISGNVHQEMNDDCARVPGEKGLARRMVEIAPGPHYTITDKDGNYSRYVGDGSYTVSLNPRTHWTTTCPVAPGTHSVTIAGLSNADGIDFAMEPIPGIQDVAVSVITGLARQGRDLTYHITYENRGTTIVNGTIKLFLDPMLTYDSASVAPARINPGLVEWDYVGLEVDEVRTIIVHTTVPIAAPMGSTICCRVEITPSIIAFSTDDRDSTCVPVTGGYDPNDIQVTPYGIEKDGVIPQNTKTLTYWVRFQNTGNDTAFNVVVTDKLSNHFDIASIRLGASSHPFTFSIDQDNNLAWRFADIMLPDSTANETNSHGFFKFSVNLKPNLPADTRIPNFVDIYFDYNPAVRTNTVTSTISALMGVDPVPVVPSLSVYPNPTRGTLMLTGDLRLGTVVKLRTILGQEVASYRHNGGDRMTIDASALPAGTYLLEAETANGLSVQRISVVR